VATGVVEPRGVATRPVFASGDECRDDEAAKLRGLTDRELEVLRVTRDGYSVAETAARLHLAQGTVRNYLSSAMQKTQTRTRHEAARYAREHDWL
jgi:DNA-binding NarL/FixJ family response regulator